MKKYCQSDKFEYNSRRKRQIDIEDSYIKYLTYFDKQSQYIRGRNPLEKDLDAVDYDMLSEDEWNEQQGIDLEDQGANEEEDEEEMEMIKEMEEEEEELAMNYIVSDDHLSASELNLTQSEDD